MAINKQLAEKLIVADDKEIVTFTFEQGDGPTKKIRFLKSILVNKSHKFATQFNDKWDHRNEVLIEDSTVDFDQYEIFLLFIECLAGLKPLKDLSISQLCYIYYYGRHYVVKGMKEDLLAAIPVLEKACNVKELGKVIKFIRDKNFEPLLKALDGVTMSFKDGWEGEDPVEFYYLCRDFKMETLMNRVAEHLKLSPIDDTWPVDLIIRIANAARRDTAKLAEVGHKVQWYCCCTTSYKNIKRCDKCKSYFGIELLPANTSSQSTSK